MKKLLILLFAIFLNHSLFAQTISLDLEANNFVANQVFMPSEKIEGMKVLKVIKDSTLKK